MDYSQELHEYESRLHRPITKKLPDFMRNERLKHVIFAKQLNRELIDHLCMTADFIRDIAKTKDGYKFLTELLLHKRAMLYFTQASTRTFLSFLNALQILGITTSEIRDPSVSSEYKGEEPLDSIRMFSSYCDIIIMRSKIPDFAECCAYLMNDLDEFNQRIVPIVNGGAGADEHPTQALLDIYTIKREFSFVSMKDSSRWTRYDELKKKYPDLQRGLDGKVYGFCGDIGRGRTVRSLTNLLCEYKDVKFYFVSPPHPKLQLAPTLKDELINDKRDVYETDDLNEIIDKVDVLYMTRIQHEHDSAQDAKFFKELDYTKYFLDAEKVARMKDSSIILHPFPRDTRHNEIPAEIDYDPRAKYFNQARNGMWARAALIAHLFDADNRISNYYQKHFSSFHDYNVGVL